MADGLNLRDIEEIKADAHKAVERQFRNAAEDNGWEPTPTPGQADAEATGTTEDELEHVTGESESDKSIAELRAEAKDLGLSAGGSKAELSQRIADAQPKEEEGA